MRSEVDRYLELAAESLGTPCFVYFTDRIQDRIDCLERHFQSAFELSFAVKSNPNPSVLQWLGGKIGHLDISSIGEMRLALDAGWLASDLSFTGPGKRDSELREAIAGGLGHLVVESLREGELADNIARSVGRVQPILIRIAPDRVPKGFGDQMAGRPSPFGIDIEDADEAIARIVKLPGLRLVGFHIYSGTQCLKADAIAENYRLYLSIFERLCEHHDIEPETLVLGSGMGVAYHEGDTPLDMRALASAAGSEIESFRALPRFRNTRLLLELGRYLISESGYFLTRVISVKTSRGSRIAICDGGMNNHLPASGHFGMVVRRNYRIHKVGAATAGGTEKIDIVGPLCTSIDRLASGAELPQLQPGDLIAVHNSGAYGLTASPIHFISHPAPSEAMVVDDRILDVSRVFGEHGTSPATTAPHGSLVPSCEDVANAAHSARRDFAA